MFIVCLCIAYRSGVMWGVLVWASTVWVFFVLLGWGCWFLSLSVGIGGCLCF